MKKTTDISTIAFSDQTKIEVQVLYDIVSNPETIGEVIGTVSRDMFTSERRRSIWDAAVRMFNAGEVIDFASIAVIAPAYTPDVILQQPEASGPLQTLRHAQILRDTAARRRTYAAAYELMQKAIDSSKTEVDMLSAAEHCKSVIENGSPLVYETELQQAFNNYADDLQEMEIRKNEGRMVRITTGFPNLDYALQHGWGPGQLIILAARPSVGKTAVMLQMARAAAAAGAIPNIYSIEMTENELSGRMLYSTGMVDPFDISALRIDWEKLEAGIRSFDKSRILMNDKTRDLDGLVSRILINAQRKQCDVAFIDYLGLIRADGYGNEKLYQTIGRITGTMKVTAKQAKIPIVLLCQLNRESAKGGRAPELYDLRDSGSIEQDADIVLMLENKDDGGINMWVRKNRQGRRDFAVVLSPNGTYSNFTDQGIIDDK